MTTAALERIKSRTAAKLHLSLARDSIRVARRFFNEIDGGWYLNGDQIEQLRDWAHDAQRDVRQHLEAAVRS